MKHPSKNIFTEYSFYRQISTHKVAKIQLLGSKSEYNVENEVLA